MVNITQLSKNGKNSHNLFWRKKWIRIFFTGHFCKTKFLTTKSLVDCSGGQFFSSIRLTEDCIDYFTSFFYFEKKIIWDNRVASFRWTFGLKSEFSINVIIKFQYDKLRKNVISRISEIFMKIEKSELFLLLNFWRIFNSASQNSIHSDFII